MTAISRNEHMDAEEAHYKRLASAMREEKVRIIYTSDRNRHNPLAQEESIRCDESHGD